MGIIEGNGAGGFGIFGDFGGESSGLIDRTFREKIVLVGVTPQGDDEEDTARHLDELALLVVHGILHLLGMDHADERGRLAMQARERDLLAAVGVHFRSTVDDLDRPVELTDDDDVSAATGSVSSFTANTVNT